MPFPVPPLPPFPSERPTTLILVIFELAMGVLFMITGIFAVSILSLFSFVLGFFLVYDGYIRLKRFFFKKRFKITRYNFINPTNDGCVRNAPKTLRNRYSRSLLPLEVPWSLLGFYRMLGNIVG